MNPQDLDRAIMAATQSTDALRAALHVSDPVSALILLPLIAQAAQITQGLESLKAALREAA